MTIKKTINALIKTIRTLLVHPGSFFLILSDQTPYSKYLHKKYGVEQLKTVDINTFLTERKGEIENYSFLDGSSLITDLVLLRSLARSLPECEYLEIGTWRGESIINVAQEAKHCTSINLSPKDIIALGYDKQYADLHGCLIKNASNITQIYANSLTFDFQTLNKKFDLIFVDGDHSYETVKSDSAKVFKLLRNDDSMIVWHDSAFNPESPRHSVIAGILDGMPVETHADIYHVSNTLCAIYTKKQVVAEYQNKYIKPDKVFNVKIENIAFD